MEAGCGNPASWGRFVVFCNYRTPPQPDVVYQRRNSTALQDIYGSCEPEQQVLIMDFTSAKECWDFLKSKYDNGILFTSESDEMAIARQEKYSNLHLPIT